MCWILVPGSSGPRKSLNEHDRRLPAISKCHIRQPLQGERCRSQRFYRHSVFIWSFTTPRRIQPICLSSSVEAITPPYVLLVEVPGTAPGSKMIIAQRFQNHHCLHSRLIINLYTGICKVFGYNALKRYRNEVPGQSKNSYQGG